MHCIVWELQLVLLSVRIVWFGLESRLPCLPTPPIGVILYSHGRRAQGDTGHGWFEILEQVKVASILQNTAQSTLIMLHSNLLSSWCNFWSGKESWTKILGLVWRLRAFKTKTCACAEYCMVHSSWKFLEAKKSIFTRIWFWRWWANDNGGS